MKNKLLAQPSIRTLKNIVSLTLIVMILSSFISNQKENEMSKNVDDSNLVPGSCTIFSVAVGDKVLFGNNEDYKDIPLYYWIQPSTTKT